MWNDSEIFQLESIGLFTMIEAGDSLDDGEAPEDTIDNDDKHKCSETNLELLKALTKVEYCRAVRNWMSVSL